MNKGFTLLEMLVVVAIFGILSTLSVPLWSSYINSSRVISLSEKALSAIRSVQSQAINNRQEIEIRFRENNGEIEVSSSVNPLWESLGEGQFNPTENDFQSIKFDFKGNVEMPNVADDFPTLAFGNDRTLRCVQVRTLIGALALESGDGCKP